MAAITLDFTNVKDPSNLNPQRLPEGDYVATIINVEMLSKDGVPMPRFDIQINDHPRAVYPYYCKLQPNQLWKIRNLLLAVGKQVPKKAIKVDLSKLTGSKLGVELSDDEYEGRLKSQISAVFPAETIAETPEPVETETSEPVKTDEDDMDFELEI